LRFQNLKNLSLFWSPHPWEPQGEGVTFFSQCSQSFPTLRNTFSTSLLPPTSFRSNGAAVPFKVLSGSHHKNPPNPPIPPPSAFFGPPGARHGLQGLFPHDTVLETGLCFFLKDTLYQILFPFSYCFFNFFFSYRGPFHSSKFSFFSSCC